MRDIDGRKFVFASAIGCMVFIAICIVLTVYGAKWLGGFLSPQ